MSDVGLRARQGRAKLILVSALAVFLSAAGALRPSGQPGQSAQVPKHDVSVTLKLIQVYVTDAKGNAVHGLRKSDFELLDDGKRIEITEFEDHVSSVAVLKDDAAAEAPGRTDQAPLSGPEVSLMPRKFILLFDFAYNNPRGLSRRKPRRITFLRRCPIPWTRSA